MSKHNELLAYLDIAGSGDENAFTQAATALRELGAENKGQGYEIARMKHPAEQYDRLADYVIENRLWRGHDGSHTDSVIKRIVELEAENEELDRKNYKLDSYNTELKAERDGLREALQNIFVMWLSGTPHYQAPNIKEAARKTLVAQWKDE